MKFPTTILLKFNHQKRTQPHNYWVVRSLLQQKINRNIAVKFKWFNDDFMIHTQFKTASKFTLLYSNAPYLKPISTVYKKLILKTQAPNPKPLTDVEWKQTLKEVSRNPRLQENLADSLHIEKQIYDYIKQPKTAFNYKKLRSMLRKFKYKLFFNSYINNKTWEKFNLIFFRKEKIYTKLKYSRVPQYDAVSGGSAALLAGFLGFLITEKFGLELTDSGDFWFIFLYFSFLSFFCQPLLKMIANDTENLSVFSYQWGFDFYLTIFISFTNFLHTNYIKRRKYFRF